MASSITRIFWNDDENRLRAPVRLICQLGLTVLTTFVAILVMGNLFSAARNHGFLAGLNKQTFDQVGNVLIAPVAGFLIYFTLKFGATKIERRDFSIYGSRLSPVWWKEFRGGFVLAAVLMTLVFVIEYLAGWIHI